MQATSPTASRMSPFKFAPFSRRQKIVLSWWTEGHPLSGHDGIIADGSIRSGKTVSMGLSFVMWAMENFNGQNFGMCGKTVGSLRRNVIVDLKKMLASRGYQVEEHRTDKLLIIRRGETVNNFYTFGGKDEASQDLVQGITLAGVLFDEVALMPESFVDQATGRCSVEGSKFWFNCNPEGRLHWFKTKWINRYQELNFLYLHFTMEDNLSLSEKIKARYRSMYAGVFYTRYIEGKWVTAEGVIYGMWNREENLYSPEEPEFDYDSGRYPRYIAIDYGTTNPMVFLDAIYDGYTMWIRNEYYYDSKKQAAQRSKTDAEYADDFEEFVEHDHGVTVIIDPSATSFRTELRNRHYHIREADNDVKNGISVVSTLIQKRRLRAMRGKCPNLEREIESYSWDPKAKERGEEKPIKQNDHAMDAMRYLCKTIMNRRRMNK